MSAMMKAKQRKLCKDCREFIARHKPWNERKVPEVSIVDVYGCSRCRMDYQTYKGMIFVSEKCGSMDEDVIE